MERAPAGPAGSRRPTRLLDTRMCIHGSAPGVRQRRPFAHVCRSLPQVSRHARQLGVSPWTPHKWQCHSTLWTLPAGQAVAAVFGGGAHRASSGAEAPH